MYSPSKEVSLERPEFYTEEILLTDKEHWEQSSSHPMEMKEERKEKKD